ncbi:zinc protease [Flavobacterium collinsii]|uniref:M16 family metallopeptidase n=1 Tax=Flavobacterium collinsii TaxID=1114861 RepID=UPI0022CA4724|nr:M16 family metallopeptidase [Flavobacterium collinsii]GIQ61195.1 zinc protease [Flavobacterium collinsii]
MPKSKMMKSVHAQLLHLLLLFIGITSINAQNYKAADALIGNKTLKKGVLSNGMTYYIYPTAVNKNTASYYIIQNVGSILENDNQKGLAHFLEHMAFNGTKNFPGKGILTTLEKQGAVFGNNINAYTSFDETVYNFDNIPSTDPKVIDTALLILHDWSHSLLLTNEEIDAERGIIVEEWRTRQNASTRISNLFNPYLYNHSLYANRVVIGDMDIVKHFDYALLRDFYKEWYRPDLQAIAVVGDVNAEEIEQKIKTLFADIPRSKNPKKRFEVAIPDHEEPFFKLAIDKEITNSAISFKIIQNGAFQSQTFADLQQLITRVMAFSMLNDRLNELAQKENCPFKSADVYYSDFTRVNDVMGMGIAPKPNKQAEAFAAVMDEFIRAGKFGFSEGEIQRTIIAITSYFENYIESEKEIPHSSIVNSIKSEFLSHQLVTDSKSKFEMIKFILKNIDSKAFQAELTRGYTSKNRVVTVEGMENETNLTKESAFAIISKSENNPDLKPYEDSFNDKSLLTDVTIVPGKITAEKESKEIGATTYTLSNGVKVHYKFANKNVNDVQLHAESFGGASLYGPEDLPSIFALNGLADASGAGAFSSIDLEKVLAGKIAGTGVSVGDLSETVSGSAKVKDLEVMLQLVHLRFVKPRFDQEIFDIKKLNLQNYLENKDKDINGKMTDSINAIVYGKNNPRIRLLDQQFIDDLSFERIKAIYKERFCDVSNFDFFIVGDVKPEVLKPLLEKYIASIPGIKREETFKDRTPVWNSNKINREVLIKMETIKSTVNIQFESDFKYTAKNAVLTDMLSDILTLRYTESLREKEGGTYGVQVSAAASRFPKNTVALSINFDSDPIKVNTLLPIVYDEIDKIRKGILIKEDIVKTKSNYLKSREDSKNFNSYSLSLLYNFSKYNINMDDPATYKDIVNNITEKDIQEFANAFLNKAKSYEIVFKPLQ